ncbi:MAG: hypothetical protein HYS53_01860 [Candidatus Aenigmarchaeota archaeon]|nr:hypothetical protein [Candidatus Aenigmarchaeota archaeon]
MAATSYGITLLVGVALTALLFNPLAALVYILVWLDILVLARAAFAESIGFELLTLAAIISGLSFGPAGGFIFSIIGIPVLASLINAAVFRAFSPRIPSVDFAAMGIAAGMAGALAASMPFFTAIIIAVIFKHALMNGIRIAMGGGMDYTSVINILFTAFALAVIKGAGLI